MFKVVCSREFKVVCSRESIAEAHVKVCVREIFNYVERTHHFFKI